MPRDQRLYMTFPNDFHRHPKLTRLPVEVRWTFVEMNGEARIADNDGVFTAEDAEFMWPIEHLNALVTSHPTRPLVVRDGDTYVIRQYAEHQQTRAEREELAAKRAEAGRKGGLAKSQASASKSQADGGKAKQSQSQSQSDLTKTSTSQSRNERARDETDSGLSTVGKTLASQAGILDVEFIRARILERLNRDLTPDRTVTVARWLIGKAKDPAGLRSPQKYVIRCINLSPAEVQQYIDEGGLAA